MTGRREVEWFDKSGVPETCRTIKTVFTDREEEVNRYTKLRKSI